MHSCARAPAHVCVLLRMHVGRARIRAREQVCVRDPMRVCPRLRPRGKLLLDF